MFGAAAAVTRRLPVAVMWILLIAMAVAIFLVLMSLSAKPGEVTGFMVGALVTGTVLRGRGHAPNEPRSPRRPTA